MIATLKENLDWNSFYDVGVLSQLLTVQSEEEFELARYFEYLLRESMWTHARNASSVFSNAKMLGYNPLRKISAIGTLYISHDPNLYININEVDPGTGLTLAEQIQLFEEDPSTENYNAIPLSEFSGSPVSIGRGTVLTLNTLSFMIAENTTYPDSTLIYPSGTPTGSNKKYLKVVIVQGLQKQISTTYTSAPFTPVPALGDDYEQVLLTRTDIEAAQNTYTKEFFNVLETNTGLSKTYTLIDSILLAAFNDQRFDMVTNTEFQTVVRFGNDITGVKLTPGSVLTISYLETQGSLGNVESLYNLVEFTVTPQTFTGTNISTVTGGSEGDSVALNSLNELLKIKERAPLQYLTISSIVTTAAYKQAIEAFPNVNQAVVFPGTFTDNEGKEKDCVYFSALYDDGSIPIGSEIEALVIGEIAYKKPPLDILKFQTPSMIPVRLYFKGEIQTAGTSVAETQSSLFSYFQNLYLVTEREFVDSFSVANSYLTQIGTISLVPDTRYILAEAILNYTSDDMTSSNLGISTLEKSFEECIILTDNYGYDLRIFIECAGEQYVYYKFLSGTFAGDLKVYTETKNNVFPTDFNNIDANKLEDVNSSDPIFKNASDVSVTDNTVTINVPSSVVDVGVIRVYGVIQNGLVQPTLEYQIVYIPDSTQGEQSSEIVVECTDLIRNY